MKNRYFKHKSRLVFILFMISVASLVVRALVNYRFHETALLYVGVPFFIALLLIFLRDPVEAIDWKKRYVNRLMDAFIIMFGSAVVLFEGFVCVVMFMPIYLIVILALFISDFLRQRAKQRGRNTVAMQVFPLLILISSFEGVLPQTSFEREEKVMVSRVVDLNVAEIKRNLQLPMNLQTTRPWFLHLFPMPYAIKAGTLSEGDVHEIYFSYQRWFFMNTHEGFMLLEISEVGDNYINTRFLEDSSYFSNYLHLKGIEILMHKINDRKTRVTLTISFARTLDPYWYFSPLERFGVSNTADFLITEVIAREKN